MPESTADKFKRLKNDTKRRAGIQAKKEIEADTAPPVEKLSTLDLYNKYNELYEEARLKGTTGDKFKCLEKLETFYEQHADEINREKSAIKSLSMTEAIVELEKFFRKFDFATPEGSISIFKEVLLKIEAEQIAKKRADK
jgi:hypothetical protein